MTALAIIYLALVALVLPVMAVAHEESGSPTAGWLLFVCSPVGIALAVVAIAHGA